MDILTATVVVIVVSKYVCLFTSCSGESEGSKPLGKGETKTGAGLSGEVSWVWELQKCESGGVLGEYAIRKL